MYEAGRRYVQEFIADVEVGPEERERALDFVSAWRPVATAPSESFGIAAGKSVIVVRLESFHAFPIGLRIGGREVTPSLDALARRSLYLENLYGQTWEGTSPPFSR